MLTLHRRLAAAILLYVLAPLAAFAQTADRWYVVEMMGGKAGWMHTFDLETDTTVTTTSKTHFSLARGGAGLSITIESEFVEGRDGKPISMKAVQKLGKNEIISEYTFTPEGIRLKSTQEGETTERTLPNPEGTWLAPAAAERYVQQRFKSGAKEITVRTMDPSNGPTVVTAVRTGFEPEKLTIAGRELDVVKTVVEMSVMPGAKSTEYIDAEGELVKSRTLVGGLAVTMTRSTREEAIAEGAGPSPEVMTSTFIYPDKPIDNPRQVKQAVLVLSVPEEPLPEVPATGSQRVEKVDATTLRLTIRADTFDPAPDADTKDPAYLAATTMCDSNDEQVKRLAAVALQAVGEDKAKRAEMLRRFVHLHITKKNLNVGFASASEVARDRAGDCSEHGVLLAAVLRADGIPARVVSGLVYADGFAGAKQIFGYHMWAQALLTIDGAPRWVDLDATLPASTPFDATHITLGTSALAEGDLTSGMVSVAGAMGRLKVKVESVK